MGQPRPLFRLLLSFKQKLQFLQQINVINVQQDERCDVSVWTYIFHWGLSSSFTGLRSILDFAFHEGSRFTFSCDLQI